MISKARFAAQNLVDGFLLNMLNFRIPTLSTKPDILREILRQNLPRHLAWSKEKRMKKQKEYFNNKKPKGYFWWTNWIARNAVAFSGAAWLVVPIIIMTVPDTSKCKFLGVLIGATLLFGYSLASVNNSLKDQEILAATAAYAAVLVVFYGNVTDITGAETVPTSPRNSTNSAQ